MSASPASQISFKSSNRISSRSPDPVSSVGTRKAPYAAITKHTKSRTGCKTCKKRKVKCDEKRPSCGNCLKHGSHCDFALLTIHLVDVEPVDSVSALNLLDLELLNNFKSSTYSSLSTDPQLRDFWKNAVVLKALGSEFVMRALLAVSATHIAQHRPSQKHYYISHAIAYHDIASRKAVSLMVDLLPENLEDLWIFSVLTMFFALGSHRGTNHDSLQIGDDILPEWAFLFNGVQQIRFALHRHPNSHNGTLWLLENHGADRWVAAHKPEHEGANILHELKARIDATVADGDEREIYAHAIQELRCQLSYVLTSRFHDLDIADAFVWHTAMAESFMPLLQQGKQEAVVIFAHSLIIFTTMNGSRWMNGWDTCLLARAWQVLDRMHRLWIQWPIKEIG